MNRDYPYFEQKFYNTFETVRTDWNKLRLSIKDLKKEWERLRKSNDGVLSTTEEAKWCNLYAACLELLQNFDTYDGDKEIAVFCGKCLSILDDISIAYANAEEARDIIDALVALNVDIRNVNGAKQFVINNTAAVYDKYVALNAIDRALTNIRATSRAKETAALSELKEKQKFVRGPETVVFLKRWNSISPNLSSQKGNVGGGFLITLRNNVIAVDPGYNFLSSMITYGISPCSITHVVMTHAHDDHTADFERIISLLFKISQVATSYLPFKELRVIGSRGVYEKYKNLLSLSQIQFSRLMINRDINIDSIYSIRGTKAIHSEMPWYKSNKTAMGFKITKAKENLIGYTGDTRSFSNLGRQYSGCRLIIVNIGYLEGADVRYHNHLGLEGVKSCIMDAWKHKRGDYMVVAISEWFRECMRLRDLIVRKIERTCVRELTQNGQNRGEMKWPIILPADLGLEIRLAEYPTFCQHDERGALIEAKVSSAYRDCKGQGCENICYLT